jgi:hypothetical protein
MRGSGSVQIITYGSGSGRLINPSGFGALLKRSIEVYLTTEDLYILF